MKWFKINMKLFWEELDKLKHAAKIVKNNGLVIYPTDTVYGLGADPLSSIAVEKVYRMKRRPLNKPLPVLISSIKIISKFAEIDSKHIRILKKYWPGPVTFVLKISDKKFFPKILTSGLDTVGVRIPDHLVTLKFIEYCGGLIVGTSANISGYPPPRRALDAVKQLKKVDAVIDIGPTPLGVPSTIIDLTRDKPIVLRKGALDIDVGEIFD